jgi:dipeptidyl aminopeptidase/acylaminoacyl peptidase
MFLAALLLAATTLSVEDYATMQVLSSPRFSPDGKRIAYVVTRADMTRSVYDADIWTIEADGRNNLQLTRGPGADFQPRWSPDGVLLGFLSDRDGKQAIFLVAAAGGEAVRLTAESSQIHDFQWSPDSKSIAFTMSDPPTTDEERRAHERDDAHVVGENRKQSHLYVIDIATRDVRRLTRGPFSVDEMSWSPDGKTIAFDRLSGMGLDDLYHADLYTIDASSACDDNSCPVMSPLVTQPGVDQHPRFSPDGKSIAFLSAGGRFDWLAEHQIWIIDLADHKKRLVSRDYDRTPDGFAWSSDSRSILFNGPLNTTSQIFRVGSDGSGFRNVSNANAVVSHADYDFRNNRAAFIFESLTSAPELFISDLKAFSPHQLTHHNDLYRGRELGETRVFRWKNPKDGLDIEGLLTLPVGYKPNSRVPLLTFVHGGPASRFDQGFLGYLGHIYAPQTLAANGFAVLRPNPRGTGGYGSRFRAANRNDWAGMDWIDINAGIDAVIAQGVADPDRMGLMGWSYGGFIASWAIGHSDRLKAISAGAPVVDLLSFHGTSDIREFIPSYFPPPEPEPQQSADATQLEPMRHMPLALDVLREHSLLWHLKKTSAHILIQQGEADDRVPLSQGTMLYRALQELGNDVTMVTYPRTLHVAREPKLRIDVARRNVDFFTKWVGGAKP